jgi:hypothetical protein
MKKIFFTTFLSSVCSLLAVGQTNVLYAPVADLGQMSQTGVKVSLHLLSPTPRFVAGVAIRPDDKAAFTDTNGIAWFTNVVWGNYSGQVFGAPGVNFNFTVHTNTAGTVNLFGLCGTTNVPPTPWQYYTASQIDALLAGIGNNPNGVTNFQPVVNFPEVFANSIDLTNFDGGSEFGGLSGLVDQLIVHATPNDGGAAAVVIEPDPASYPGDNLQVYSGGNGFQFSVGGASALAANESYVKIFDSIYFVPPNSGFGPGFGEIAFDDQYGAATFLNSAIQLLNGNWFNGSPSPIALWSSGDASFENGAIITEGGAPAPGDAAIGFGADGSFMAGGFGVWSTTEYYQNYFNSFTINLDEQTGQASFLNGAVTFTNGDAVQGLTAGIYIGNDGTISGNSFELGTNDDIRYVAQFGGGGQVDMLNGSAIGSGDAIDMGTDGSLSAAGGADEFHADGTVSLDGGYVTVTGEGNVGLANLEFAVNGAVQDYLNREAIDPNYRQLFDQSGDEVASWQFGDLNDRTGASAVEWINRKLDGPWIAATISLTNVQAGTGAFTNSLTLGGYMVSTTNNMGPVRLTNLANLFAGSFTGNAGGETNFTGLVITNSATGYLTAGAYKAAPALGFVSVTVEVTNSQVVWLTNQTTHAAVLMGNIVGMWTNFDNASLCVNTGDSVGITNASGTGGAGLVNSYFQALH